MSSWLVENVQVFRSVSRLRGVANRRMPSSTKLSGIVLLGLRSADFSTDSRIFRIFLQTSILIIRTFRVLLPGLRRSPWQPTIPRMDPLERDL